MWEGRERKKQGKKNKNFSSPVARPGEEEGETMLPKKQHYLFSFFCGKCMKQRRVAQNTSFHLNGN
jgi:hypothetical protein